MRVSFGLRQAVAIGVLGMVGSALAFGTARIVGIVFGAGAAVAVEAPADLGLPQSLALPSVAWNSAAKVSALVQEQVGAAYQESWDALSAETGEVSPSDWDRYFTGPALGFALDGRAPFSDSGTVVSTGSHTLTPVFVHPEEWMLSFTDTDLAVSRVVGGVEIATTETFHVVMVIERGRWMIHTLVREVHGG